MLGRVECPRQSLDEHRRYAGDEVVDHLRKLAEPLKGARVLNLGVSPYGTGVAALLRSIVPLLKDLGLEADWQVVTCDNEFCKVGRLMYVGLSGRHVGWTNEHKNNWRLYGEMNARLLGGEYDVVIAHDPQPAGALAALTERGNSPLKQARWVWHCHLDLRKTQMAVWETFREVLRLYDAWVLPDSSFAPPGDRHPAIAVIPPAIDPTAARNMPLPTEAVEQFQRAYGIDPTRPVILQVAPFDATFDPLGALEIYHRAKAQRPDLQLVLVDSIAQPTLDDWSRFERVSRQLGTDPDAHMLCGQGDGGQAIINSAQRSAWAVIQRSVPAGFSLPVWEALWKGRPVVAGLSGGLPLQVRHEENGYLAASDDQFVEHLLGLISDRQYAAELGETGRECVRQKHLITRFLGNELRLLGTLLSSGWTQSKVEVRTPVRPAGGRTQDGHVSGVEGVNTLVDRKDGM
jgi:trehalose synthase